MNQFRQGGQKIWKKTCPIFQKVAKTVVKPRAKISTSKLNLRVQNIYIKPLLKP